MFELRLEISRPSSVNLGLEDVENAIFSNATAPKKLATWRRVIHLKVVGTDVAALSPPRTSLKKPFPEMRSHKQTARLSRRAGLYLLGAVVLMIVIGGVAYWAQTRYGFHLHRGRERHR
jgi:hypothetical protein